MTDEKEETSRVTMLWPVSLKESVRERVGSRGLTEFVVDAVQAKLGTHDSHKAGAKELNEVKFLTQQLADALAMGGDYQDRFTTLQEIGLPAWLDTTGWPQGEASLVKVEDSTPEPVDLSPPTLAGGPNPFAGENPTGVDPFPSQVQTPVENEDEELHRPMFMVGSKKAGKSPMPASPEAQEAVGELSLPAVGDPGTVRSEAPAPPKDDLMARIQGKAAEKGVDLSGVDLKPASSMAPKVYGHDREGEQCAPEVCGGTRGDACNYTPAQIATFEAETAADLKARDALAAPPPVIEQLERVVVISPELDANVCLDCKAELVNGECWECM